MSTPPLRVLFLHGVPTDGGLWDGVRRALTRASPEAQLLAPDLPGFGAAPPLPEPTPAAYVAGLAPLVDEATHLVGHDYGGLIAALIAAARPVRSLTLASTALGPGWLPSRLTALPPLNRFFYRAFSGRRWLAMGSLRPAELLARFPGADPARMEAIARRLPIRGAPRPPCPTLCLWGGADRSFPAWQGRHLARSLGAGFVALPGLRHYAMWDDPDAFTRALQGFWSRLP